MAADLTIVQAAVEPWLQQGAARPFDIVFIDPPYQNLALANCFALLSQHNWVQAGSLLYFEHNARVPEELLPQGWRLLKQQQAGQVHYYLVQVEATVCRSI